MADDDSSSRKKRRFRLFGRKKAKAPSASRSAPAAVSAAPVPALTPPPKIVRVGSKSQTNGVQKKKKVKRKTTWLTRTKYFKQLSEWAFTMVDTDQSGGVDEKELYSGMLLIHLKLGCYAGPAACRPVGRERVHAMFHKMDVDNSGYLDKEEFEVVMSVLCANVLTRVMLQWTLTLIVVPLIAKKLLDSIYFLNGHFWHFVMDLDEYSPTMDKVEVFIEGLRDDVLEKTPEIILKFCSNVGALLAKVPDSVWNTVPLTLISCVLGILVVPYCIYLTDDYFQHLAEKNKQNLRLEDDPDDD